MPRRVVAALVLAVVSFAVVAIVAATSEGHHRARTTREPRSRDRPHRVHRESPAVARIAARQRRVDSDAIRRAIARSDYISLGSPRRRDIALTFDDGPGPYTPQILRVLVRRHAAATFFVVGSAVRQRPALVRDEQRLGFAIGNHTQDHLALGTLSSAAQLAQITQAGGAIRRAGAAPAPLFRPPYGSFSPTTLQLLRLEGLLMVLWTVDTKDYQRPGVQRIAYTALSGARGGAILLMHDGGGDRSQTVAALPTIIRRLRARGFHLVTVPQLVRDDPPPAHQPPPHSLAGAWSRVSGRTSTRPSPAGPPRR